jgi:hypothetical protein
MRTKGENKKPHSRKLNKENKEDRIGNKLKII